MFIPRFNVHCHSNEKHIFICLWWLIMSYWINIFLNGDHFFLSDQYFWHFISIKVRIFVNLFENHLEIEVSLKTYIVFYLLEVPLNKISWRCCQHFFSRNFSKKKGLFKTSVRSSRRWKVWKWTSIKVQFYLDILGLVFKLPSLHLLMATARCLIDFSVGALALCILPPKGHRAFWGL